MNGLYYGDSWFSQTNKKDFMAGYGKVGEFFTISPSVTILVACLTEDPNIILGYSIFSADETTLHWVYMKKKWRKLGIAKAMVPSTINVCTHLTALGAILKTKIPNITFNPFKIE